MTTKSQWDIADVSESSVGINNAFDIQNWLSGILAPAVFFVCAKSRRATPQSAVKQRRKPKINVSSLLTSPSFACFLCIRAQRVQSVAWIIHQNVSLLAHFDISLRFRAWKAYSAWDAILRICLAIILIDAIPSDIWSLLDALWHNVSTGLPL